MSKKNEVLELLASLEHEQWIHWTKYMLENLTDENIKRWKRQIKTPYYKLSEEEKESDRKLARKVLALLKGLNCEGCFHQKKKELMNIHVLYVQDQQ